METEEISPGHNYLTAHSSDVNIFSKVDLELL